MSIGACCKDADQFTGGERKKLRDQGLEKIIYMDLKITKDFECSCDGETDSEPGVNAFKK